VATNRSNATSGSTTLIPVVLVVAVLYFAREVFIPLALAILFSFLLGPLVGRLRRWGMWRVPAVLSIVLLAFVILAVIGGLVTMQLTDLGHKLPQYQQNIRDKLHSFRDSSGGVIGRFSRIIRDFNDELNPAPPPSAPGAPNPDKPVPVEIRRTTFSPLDTVRGVLGSVFNVLIMAVIVIVFVIFMLLQREDLRDRFIRLIGARQMNLTTKALDEAAQRVSRYLVAQLLVNIAFGIPAGLCLYFIGVPNPVLWGVLAALLRYIPYLGVWIAATMPAALAFAVDPSWVKPVLVLGSFLAIDLIMYNFVEPPLYGTSTGITPLAILFAAVFWTWLWGPVGLLLATPLTVCVAVVGRYVPSLQFLNILLNDEPVLSPENRFYQRLLAADVEELMEIAEEFLKAKSLEELYDEVILPALSLAEQDRHSGKLDEKQQQFIFDNARHVVNAMAERADEIAAKVHAEAGDADVPSLTVEPRPDITVLSLPARDEADEIGALMLARLLNRRGVGAKAVSAEALTSECLEEAGREKIQIVCVSAVPPFGYVRARYLCKRLRGQFPEMKIFAAILNTPDAQELKKQEPPIPADSIVGSLTQAVAGILSLMPAVQERVEPTAVSS
jgi:predicted PurR-regulated permease PerM